VDANLTCAMMSQAIKIAKAYDYKIDCITNDACSVANIYFAQKFIDLNSGCSDIATLEKHVSCYSFPNVAPNPVTQTSCQVTITETDPTECRVVTITVVQ
jgi:hypothetical protein